MFDLYALSHQPSDPNVSFQKKDSNRSSKSPSPTPWGGNRGDNRRQSTSTSKYARNNRHSNSPSPSFASGSASARASPELIDSNNLTNDVSKIMLTVQTESLLYQIFSDPSVLKVGWGFMNEDVKMIRRSRKG